jgi:Peptidase family M48
MMMVGAMRVFLALLLLVTGIATARAQCPPTFDWRGFYPPEILDRVAQRSTPGLRANFDEVVLPRLTDQERAVLKDVRLDLSQREYRQHPLNFYAAQGGQVVLPLSSVRLINDLTLALAWLNRNDLPEKRVFDYAAMLAYRGPAPDGVRVSPLSALGIPLDADSDPAVESLHQKMFGGMMVFVMAHELGHLFHDHHADVGAAQSRAQENEADAFAVDLMARIGAAPIGVSFYFLMAAPFECPASSTHPLSGERVARLASAITEQASVFVRDKPDPTRERQLVEGIAAELQKVAALVDDPDVRHATRQVGMSFSVTDFAAASSPGRGRLTLEKQTFEGSYSGQWVDASGTALDINMVLKRQGEIVRGKYEFGLGSVELEGIVDGDQFNYAWRWGNDHFGRGSLRSTTGGRLQGTWGYTQRSEGGGTVVATPQ